MLRTPHTLHACAHLVDGGSPHLALEAAKELVACHPAAIQLVLHIDAHQTNLPYTADSGEQTIAFGADISDQRK
jgi:hypothetical protein